MICTSLSISRMSFKVNLLLSLLSLWFTFTRHFSYLSNETIKSNWISLNPESSTWFAHRRMLIPSPILICSRCVICQVFVFHLARIFFVGSKSRSQIIFLRVWCVRKIIKASKKKEKGNQFRLRLSFVQAANNDYCQSMSKIDRIDFLLRVDEKRMEHKTRMSLIYFQSEIRSEVQEANSL